MKVSGQFHAPLALTFGENAGIEQEAGLASEPVRTFRESLCPSLLCEPCFLPKFREGRSYTMDVGRMQRCAVTSCIVCCLLQVIVE